MLKPKSEWRAGLTKKDLINELDAKLQIPGVVNGWTQPIINRINMLATGIRTDVGIKVHGQSLDSIYAVSEQVKAALEGVPGVKDLYVEPVTGGKYLTVDVNRDALGRYGLTVDDVNGVVESAIGGSPIGQTIEGRRRFSINVRLAQDYRNSVERIRRIPIATAGFGTIPLSAVATVRFEDGPPMRVTPNSPSVSVPVLSNTIAVIFRDSSKAVRFRMSSPFCAEMAVEIATTSGIATPSAWGQAVTITVTIRSMANDGSLPTANQTMSVSTPTVSEIRVNQPAARSASVCVCDLAF